MEPAEDGRRALRLRLEGQIRGQWVDEFRRACAQAWRDPDSFHLLLDLSEVTFVDTEGLALLQELLVQPVTLERCSLFVRAQLDEAANGR